MKRYENMMEAIVEEGLDMMGDSLGCCMTGGDRKSGV